MYAYRFSVVKFFLGTCGVVGRRKEDRNVYLTRYWGSKGQEEQEEICNKNARENCLILEFQTVVSLQFNPHLSE